MRNPAAGPHGQTSDDGAAVAGIAASGLAVVLIAMAMALAELALLMQHPLGAFLR